MAVVASANGGGALRAGPGHRERHSRRGDGMHKRRLSGRWNEKVKNLNQLFGKRISRRGHSTEKHSSRSYFWRDFVKTC